MTKRRRKAQTVGDLVARGITPSDVPPVTALIARREADVRNGRLREGSVPKQSDEFGRAIDTVIAFYGLLGDLLRTCDDAIKGRISEGSRLALMGSCDDVRAALGYSHRYLKPRQRRKV